MTFVKICGLTRVDDARLSVSLGATHIGVVRTESSPRSVGPEAARDVFAAVEERAETVFVFKDIPLSQVIADAEIARPKSVQLYDASDEDIRTVAAEGYRVFRVYHMDEDSRSLPRFDPPPSERQPALLDVGGGGSGRSFDWRLLGERAPDRTFIAGGIRPDNVHSLRRYRPYGIDLASGVESRPGVKDEEKLMKLFEEVSRW